MAMSEFHKQIYRSLFFAFCVLGTACVQAQIDSHYWTHQYGAKGLLLNGAVIASSDDETNIFYNPGAMGLDDNLGFAFSFLSPTYSNLLSRNFLGEGSSLTDNGIDLSPGFLAVRFQPFKTDKITLAVASFERFKSDIRFADRETTPVNSTGFFFLRADVDFSQRISEDWFGIGVSYNITDRLGIGLTQFSTWLDRSLDLHLKKEIVASPAPMDIVASWRNEFKYDISIYSAFVTKLGISYQGPVFSAGLTITTPSYGMLHSSVNYAIDDQRIINAEDQNEVRSNRNDIDLTNYKSPLSVGFGLEFHREKFCYSFSTEYFRSIDQYVLFSDTDDSFNGMTLGDAETIARVRTGNENVLNFAFGLQYYPNDKITWITGFRTDFNQNTRLLLNDTAEYLGSTPDVFHISGGGMFEYGKNTFSIGMDLGYGRRAGGRQLTNLDEVTVDNLFSFSGKDNVKNEFYSIMLFITYDFILQNISKTKDK